MLSGCPDELLRGSGNAGPTSTRLKGKARKAAKQAGPASGATPQKPKYVLATKTYVFLAQFIVDHHKDKTKDSVDLPLEFSLAIEGAITVRRGFAALLEKAGATLDMTADEMHKFFVGLLEQTTVSNPFDILEAYDPPDLNTAAETETATEELPTPIGQPRKAKADFIEYEAESANTPAERFLAFIALGRDLNALRERVRALWKFYKDNDFCMISTLIFLNGWVAQVDLSDEDGYSDMSLGYNGSIGRYDKTVPYHTLSNEQKFGADREHIMEVLPEFHRLGGFAFHKSDKPTPPVLDELSRASI
ncbi:hypothetical protein B0T14DRAFT_148566 [Immersiella caudata]|uniref:DUF6604 domain-containing protein n=1 Tax=Immersiella caudata TaxID=314043 RepID=A0AA39WVK2_9PEZI|nr:hypothetical protein B0T14DRAFT_148566 [Immersiella caudata]